MTSLLEELNRSYEDNHNQEKMTVEKMKEKISDEISPVEKGPPKKFRLGLVISDFELTSNDLHLNRIVSGMIVRSTSYEFLIKP